MRNQAFYLKFQRVFALIHVKQILVFSNENVAGRKFLNNSVGIYQVKVNSRKTRTRCEIFLKLTIKTPERLTLNIFHFFF